MKLLKKLLFIFDMVLTIGHLIKVDENIKADSEQ